MRRITGALWAINKLSDLAVFMIFLGSILVERCEFVLYNERSKKRSDNISKIFSSTQELFHVVARNVVTVEESSFNYSFLVSWLVCSFPDRGEREREKSEDAISGTITWEWHLSGQF